MSVSGEKLKHLNTVVGNNDEILCLTFIGKDNSHLLVGCNSTALRLYKVVIFIRDLKGYDNGR